MTKSKVVEITVANAVKAYRDAPKEFKATLENLIGKDVLNVSITDQVKTFEDALELVGCSEDMKLLILDYDGMDKDVLASQALAKLTIIAKALNEGWKPDWTNNSEYKYYAWFKGSSGAFVFDGCSDDCSRSNVGSRLVFKSAELAKYAGKQFEGIYQTMFSL